MKVETGDLECLVYIESDANDLEQTNLAKFAFELIDKKIKKLILRFTDNYRHEKNVYDLLFNTILNNPHLICLSIEGPFKITYDQFAILKNKNLTLELKYGVIAKVEDVVKLLQEFTITHLELNQTTPSHYSNENNLSEDQIFTLCKLIDKQPALKSLILPLPDNYSEKLIIRLSQLENIQEIEKFGFSTVCSAKDILQIISRAKNIKNLGFFGIHDLSEKNVELFDGIKMYLKLSHFTLHAWKEDASDSLIKGLSELPYLESILLNCRESEEFFSKLPNLVMHNFNIKSIELLHESIDISKKLNSNLTIYPQLYDMSRFSPNLIRFRCALRIFYKYFIFGDKENGINLVRSDLMTYGISYENRNKAINDLNNPHQQYYLNLYLSQFQHFLSKATVKPSNWSELRTPPLYNLCVQKSFSFFKMNPSQLHMWQKLPGEVKKMFTSLSK